MREAFSVISLSLKPLLLCKTVLEVASVAVASNASAFALLIFLPASNFISKI